MQVCLKGFWSSRITWENANVLVRQNRRLLLEESAQSGAKKMRTVCGTRSILDKQDEK